MKRSKAIEQVLKSGSAKQRILLYLTDIALINVYPNNIVYTIEGEDVKIEGTTLLTAEEREMLWRSIKKPKEVEYYEKLRKLNSVFIYFKEKYTVDFMRLTAVYYSLAGMHEGEQERANSMELVNKLLDLYPDKKTREQAINLALEITKDSGAIKLSKRIRSRSFFEAHGDIKKGVLRKRERLWMGKVINKTDYLTMDREVYWGLSKSWIIAAIGISRECKKYISAFKTITDEDLPLKPYKEYVKREEEKLSSLINAIYSITTEVKDYPKDYPDVELYENVPDDITEEDIEDFKSQTL